MALWTLIVWLVIGAVAGILARKIMGGISPFGLIGDIILGIAGGYMIALAGLGNTTGGLIATIITAVIGAVFLVSTTRFLKKS
jgi:uncharacterized membrane protein YeaQ/YmgE (transglycosylase-associated protein family)